MTQGWQPPSSLEERVRAALIPARWRLAYKAWREARFGEREFRLLPNLVAPGRVALDVGANRGVWTYALQKLAREIHAFEPNTKMFADLSAALKGRAVLHPLALSDRTGEAEFRVPRGRRGYSNQGGSLSATAVPRDYGVMTVRTARLDDLGIADVGFIKIDVEGAELAVIAGARETLRRDRPVLVVELEERHTGRPIEAMIGDIETHGYAAFGLLDGVLTPWRTIDMDVWHRGLVGRPGYLFNFIFQPLG